MSLRFLALAAYTATLVVAQSSAPAFVPTPAKGHFVEQFLSDWADRWSPSRATKEDKTGEVFSYIGQWAVEEPTVLPGIPGDMGLVIKSKAAHHAISAPFDYPLDNTGKTLVVQYEVKLQKGLDCGGAYLKLLTDSDIGIQAEEFSDKTPYTIMFGPDRCGSTAKTHFIFRHKSPLTGEVEEKHLTAPPAPKTTKTTNLYTLIVRSDQTYEIKINDESVKTGSLLTDFTPSVNPPTEIDDPTDVKPADWVESPKISDPDAVKPADWDEDASETIVDETAVKPDGWLEDEEATIPDPDAEKPEEWSDEDDGDWIAPAVPNPKCEEAPGCGPWNRPQIANPAYKGKWFAPLIDNPEYKGVWAPKKIPNPDYFNDSTPADFNKMAAVGFEIWSMTEDILFDNIYIGDSEAEATAFAAATFHVKKALEDALEAATTPAQAEAALGEEPDYKTDPVGYAKFKVQEFINIAVEDPVAAFKTKPYTGAATSVAFATLVGMLGVLFSLLIPGPKVKVNKKAAVAKKTDAVTADDSTAAAEEVKDAPIAGEEKSEETTRVTRAAKGKAAQ